MKEKIIRFFEEIYYGIKLKCHNQLYAVDYRLGKLLYDILENDNIVECRVDNLLFQLDIKTDHYYITLWDSGKYHSWLCRGKITPIDTSRIILEWDNRCISKKYMYKIQEKINCYFDIKISQGEQDIYNELNRLIVILKENQHEIF